MMITTSTKSTTIEMHQITVTAGPARSVGTTSWDVDSVRITRVVEHVMPFPVHLRLPDR
jgi:hypothetical protein